MGGFSLFSFDLFGLFRSLGERNIEKELDVGPAVQGNINFFGMFPLL